MKTRPLDVLSRFQRWHLRRIVRLVVQQGWQEARIKEYFQLLIHAMRVQYRGDNDITLRGYLHEVFEKALAAEGLGSDVEISTRKE